MIITNKVAIYVRVSTTNQAEEGYSIDGQCDKLKAYCAIRDWSVYNVYVDGGFSGSNVVRPALQELIKDAENKRFDTVLVYKLDRLSRSVRDTLYLVRDVFEKHKIDFVSLQENIDTSSAIGNLFLTVISAIAEFERGTITERMMMGKLGRAKSGKPMSWITPPFGYDYFPEQSLLLPNPVQAPIVERIFNEYINQKPIKKIADDLNKEGHVGKTTIWKPNSLRHLLKNDIYAGYIVYKDQIFEGVHEAIISKDTLLMAKEEAKKRRLETAIRTNNPRPYQSKYMLSGLLKCGYCGKRVTLYVSKKRVDGSTLKKYHCVNRNKGCQSGLISFESLEQCVITEIERFKLDKDYLSRSSITAVPKIDKEQIASEIEKIDSKLSKLNDLYLNDMIDMSEMKEKSKHLIRDRDVLEDQLNKEDQEEILAKKQLNILARLEKTDLSTTYYETKKGLVKTLISTIYVKDNQVKITWNF